MATTIKAKNTSEPAPRWFRITKKIVYGLFATALFSSTLQRFGVFPAAMAETIVIGTGTGTQRFKIDSTGKTFVLGAINVGAAPTYADNTEALAAGLVAGDVYKTASGVLMITY